jgi:Fur family transcriptional regulator, ferric uptake regulator
MTCHKALLQQLQEEGLRLTPQRALILEDLYHNPGHRTAEDIFAHVSGRLPGLNRATVYRTLDTLHGAHVLCTFVGSDGRTEYELVRTGEAMHHHLLCRRCGAEIAFDPAPIERLKADILARTGFVAELQHLVIGGLCPACAKEETEGQPPAGSEPARPV